ncbi:hypothetical protein [Marivirga sp.]|uniref:hypothetical protein n=1 Tax=Marivirga sp. TaxID=2018662 RepID=UPI002D7F02C9|nr:hypothetical protein [Marivirga sp.]HET8858773.1 hypothetical protein [Marivirga sp.]
MLAAIKIWNTSGISFDMDAQERRKVFLTNALALFVAIYTFAVALNDFFIVEYYLAGYRRLAISILMFLIPYLNSKKHFNLSKSIFLFLPSFAQFGIPILIGDITESQFIWFQYVAAIFCSVPFLLFNQEKDRGLIILFFTYYLLITLFIDRGLLYALETPLQPAISDYISDFNRYKFPPLFIALFSSATLMWYNNTNYKYEKILKKTNLELNEMQEELISKNEEYEAINRNLEAMVEERTKQIKSKNSQIIDYAYINAHKVRGPLARIMGLINISEYSNDPEELKNIFDKLRPPSQELNVIIDEINRTLEEGNSNDVEEK